MATYIVNELVTNNAAHPDYLDKINWYFIPSANPDGYSWSWDHDRLWRKTRSAQSHYNSFSQLTNHRSDHGSALGCKGVDPNRNWGFHFAESGLVL